MLTPYKYEAPGIDSGNVVHGSARGRSDSARRHADVGGTAGGAL